MAKSSGKAYFLSDLHLGACYREDSREIEKRVVKFLDSIKEEAGELFLLGDILDYWYEYRYVVPRGYVRFLGKLAELSDSGIKITWIIGNHDIWIFDYIPSETGVTVIDGILDCTVLGVPFSMQHGDAIGGSAKFRFIRSLFRNKTCQKLYSNIHPRWTVGFAYSWSRHSRMKKRVVGEWPRNLIDSIREWCERRIESGDPARYYLFGHLHRLYDEPLDTDRHLIVLPDWPSTEMYGVFNGNEFKIEKFNK